MASSSLLTKAAAEIESKNNALRRVRNERKEDEAEILGGLVQLGSAVGAAFVDTRWGSPEGPATWKGIPVNAGLGLISLGVALIPGVPGRKLIARNGVMLGGIATYRYMVDNGTFGEQG